MSEAETRQKLIQVLQGAYSGEMAAAFAYRGHWKSLKSGPEKDKIRTIEAEEWHHRGLVLGMLQTLHAKPVKWREVVFWTIGRILGPLCFVSGWFFPMFFAGRLETANVGEYSVAQQYATELNLHTFAAQLQTMSDVELDHEIFFHETIKDHALMPLMKLLFRFNPHYLQIENQQRHLS